MRLAWVLVSVALARAANAQELWIRDVRLVDGSGAPARFGVAKRASTAG